jgi:hypothetical protein
MGAVIIGWTAVAIVVGIIAQRGLGRTGLAWGPRRSLWKSLMLQSYRENPTRCSLTHAL